MTKKWKALLRTLLLVLSGLVLGVNLYLWNARSLTGNQMPMPFGFGAAVVLTGSMEPAISADDLILVRERPDYQEKEIVVYQSGSILVVHRIIAVEGTTVTTQGDANNAPDSPVEKAAIKGKVIGVIPGAGKVTRFLKTPAVTVTLLVSALLLSELSFRKDKKKDEDQLDQLKEEIRRLKAEQE